MIGVVGLATVAVIVFVYYSGPWNREVHSVWLMPILLRRAIHNTSIARDEPEQLASTYG